ncbi:hypothetical protein, partial [Heyndrickxia sporothermodurans]
CSFHYVSLLGTLSSIIFITLTVQVHLGAIELITLKRSVYFADTSIDLENTASHFGSTYTQQKKQI